MTFSDADASRASNTDEALARRAFRDHLCRQPEDPLQERVRLIRFWLKCAETNKHYLPFRGCWMHTLARGNFRHLLLPGLRAKLEAQDKAWQAAYNAQLQADSRRWQLVKAERAAEKKRTSLPQREMFSESTP